MLVGAGVDPDTKDIWAVEITDRQAMQLGLPSDPEILGCGTMACAYASEEPGRVVKITKDVRDARMSYIVSENPQPWAVPIYGVWSVGKGLYAIVAQRVIPLREGDPMLAAALDEMWDKARIENLNYGGWSGFREVRLGDIDDEIAEKGSGGDAALRAKAVEITDEAVRGFGTLGMGWLDFHGGNWGIDASGRPVVLDLGLSQPMEQPPVRALERAAGGAIPIL